MAASKPAGALLTLEILAPIGLLALALAHPVDIDQKKVDAQQARRILDPMHPTKLVTLIAALRALGRRLVIGVEHADAA